MCCTTVFIFFLFIVTRCCHIVSYKQKSCRIRSYNEASFVVGVSYSRNYSIHVDMAGLFLFCWGLWWGKRFHVHLHMYICVCMYAFACMRFHVFAINWPRLLGKLVRLLQSCWWKGTIAVSQSTTSVCLAWAMSHSFCVCVRVCLLDMNLNLRQAARHHLCTRGNEFSAFMAVEQA